MSDPPPPAPPPSPPLPPPPPRRARALLCLQCFPPLLKSAGGAAKDSLALCRALVDGLGWQVTVVTQVDISSSGEAEVDGWLSSGALRWVPAGLVTVISKYGVVAIFDLFSPARLPALLRELAAGRYDVCLVDDVLFRAVLLLLARGFGVPTIATTHTDVPGLDSYRDVRALRLVWGLHVLSTFVATVHTTVSSVFARLMWTRYYAPVHATWPPVLWSDEFRRPPGECRAAGAAERARWQAYLAFEPKAILIYVGRWSEEKRIRLLMDATPDDCALVVLGDGDTAYADLVEADRRRNVLPLRRALGAGEV